MLAAPCTCACTGPEPPLPTIPQDVAAFFERYRDSFNALDGAAIADLYAEPSAMAQGGTLTHWPTRALVRDNMVALCSIYRNKEYGHADFELTSFIAQGSQYAIADLRWRISWLDAAEPWAFRTTYNLVRTDSGWKVLLCTAYEEDRFHRSSSAV